GLTQSYTLSLHDALPISVLVTSVFGFLLAAVVVIPFLEFLFQSATYLQRSAGGRNPYYVELHKWPALIIPHILGSPIKWKGITRSEEHTSELQSRENLVC